MKETIEKKGITGFQLIRNVRFKIMDHVWPQLNIQAKSERMHKLHVD